MKGRMKGGRKKTSKEKSMKESKDSNNALFNEIEKLYQQKEKFQSLSSVRLRINRY